MPVVQEAGGQAQKILYPSAFGRQSVPFIASHYTNCARATPLLSLKAFVAYERVKPTYIYIYICIYILNFLRHAAQSPFFLCKILFISCVIFFGS